MDWVMLLGSAAAIVTTIAFLPQVVKVIRTRQTKDISLGMYVVISIGLLLWFTYGIITVNYPIIFANGAAFCLSLLVLGYKLKLG